MTLPRQRSLPTPSIIVVSYNSEADILECLGGLGAFHVIVVDNASTDRTRDLLRQLSADGTVDEVILNTDNLGFAAAVNIGLRAAPAGDILLLNPDARIDEASIRILSSVAVGDSIGIVAPLIDNGPTIQVLSAGEQPRLWPMFTHFSGLSRAFPRSRRLRGRHLYRRGIHSPVQTVGWVSGGCLYLTGRARERVGLLSERWFMYGEDIDLCRRVTEAGLDVVVASESTARHAVGSSVNAASGAVSTMWARNTLDYYRTTFAPSTLTLFAWRVVFSAGLSSRAALMSTKAVLRSSSRNELTSRARRFRAQSRAIWARSA